MVVSELVGVEVDIMPIKTQRKRTKEGLEYIKSATPTPYPEQRKDRPHIYKTSGFLSC